MIPLIQTTPRPRLDYLELPRATPPPPPHNPLGEGGSSEGHLVTCNPVVFSFNRRLFLHHQFKERFKSRITCLLYLRKH